MRRRTRTKPQVAGHKPELPRGLDFVVIGLVLLAIALSAWLSYLYYSSSRTSFCPAGSGCDIVRASPHSRFIGIPIPLIGVAGYSLILLLGLWPRNSKEKSLSLYLLALAGFTFALYLTYLEFFVIKAVCPYCVATAISAGGIFIVLLLRRPWKATASLRQLAALSTFVVAVVLVVSALAPTSLAQEKAAEEDSRVGLAQHLTAIGAVMYGAWWCPHCQEQKEMFGDAFRYINYVECDPRGENANPELCKQEGIRGYPTWDIKEKRYEGAILLPTLASLSGYNWQGP
ncbi:MAG: vitamin K epoxide reductase family protein [Chloroflexi bacterium]|nr:vitamin K epoxide reductase family protein [Chloroflexota bacterium]